MMRGVTVLLLMNLPPVRLVPLLPISVVKCVVSVHVSQLIDKVPYAIASVLKRKDGRQCIFSYYQVDPENGFGRSRTI